MSKSECLFNFSKENAKHCAFSKIYLSRISMQNIYYYDYGPVTSRSQYRCVSVPLYLSRYRSIVRCDEGMGRQALWSNSVVRTVGEGTLTGENTFIYVISYPQATRLHSFFSAIPTRLCSYDLIPVVHCALYFGLKCSK